MKNVNEALADVKVEGTDPFNDLSKENDTPSESPTENKQTDEKVVGEPSSGESTEKNTEKPKPFHEDPRWQEMHRKSQRVDDLEKEINELKAFREEAKGKFETSKVSDVKVPDWFKELYGDNPVAWEKYSEHSKNEREEIKAELKREQESEIRLAREQEEHWNKWVGDELSKLEASGKKFDKNELLKIIIETRPTDEKGNVDFEAGFKTYEYRHPKTDPVKSLARKKLADTSASRGEPSSRDYKIPSDFKGRGLSAPLPDL